MGMLLPMTRQVYRELMDANDNLYERPIGHISRRGLEKRRVDFLKKYICFVMTGRMVSDTTKIYIRSAGSSVAEAFRLHNTGLPEEQQINIKRIVEEAYSLNGIVKIICINHENLYVDTSRYFVPDSWKPLTMTYNVPVAQNSYICRKGLKHLNINIDMPNSVESVIKDIKKRDLGYFRPVTMTVKKPAKSKP